MTETEMFKTARNEQRSALTEAEAKKLLATRGLAVPDGEIVDSSETAVQAAEKIGYPVVAKVASRSVQHKSEWGDGISVNMNLENPQKVRTAATDILDAADRQVVGSTTGPQIR